MSIQNDTFILSKRGWLLATVIAAFFLFFTMTTLHLFQFITGALLIAILAIFRNPERNTTINEPNSIISCVDGVVLSVEDVNIDDKSMTKITVLNALWDVSMLRTPFDSTVIGHRIRRGASLPLYHPLADTLNEKAVISFRSAAGEELFVEHLSEQSCFPIGIDLTQEQRMKEGGRYGFMAKGRSAIYLPEGAKVSIATGMQVRAGETLIGHLGTLS